MVLRRRGRIFREGRGKESGVGLHVYGVFGQSKHVRYEMRIELDGMGPYE